MSLNQAPDLSNDLIKPMEDLSIKSKDLLLSFGKFLKSSIFYFAILTAPLIVFILVFHFEIFNSIFEDKGVYNSSIVTGIISLFLGYWLYKSALFANKPNENMKEVIGDNLISLITLSLLSYDLIVTFYQYNLSTGLTIEQFHSVKTLIIVFVLLDFILGLKASYYYYRINNPKEIVDDADDVIDAEFKEVDKDNEQIEDHSHEDDESENQYEKDRFWKKVALFVGLAMIVILGIFVLLGTP